MKHAYLIIAHNEFVFLQKLIDVLDDSLVDIYVLFDSKVKVLPHLHSRNSNLTILNNRVSIYWGHHSQIEAEMLLFKEVANKDYQYCHLISGTHLPLYSQEYFRTYFNRIYPKQLFCSLPTHSTEADMKVQYRSFFIQYYRHPNKLISRLSQYGWVFFLKLQRFLGSKRISYNAYVKCSNWVSITQEAVNYLVSKDAEIQRNFKYTFCADEFFVPTVLKNSKLLNEFIISDNVLYQEFEDTRAKTLTMSDYDKLMDSKALFGRKFSESSFELVDKIVINYSNR